MGEALYSNPVCCMLGGFSVVGACRLLGWAKSWCQNEDSQRVHANQYSLGPLLLTYLLPQWAQLTLPSPVQSLSSVRLFVTPWITARQASLSITNSQSSLRLMSIESVMPSRHLILCHPLLLLPPITPSIRVFSNESTLRMRWPKYWSFSFSISPF